MTIETRDADLPLSEVPDGPWRIAPSIYNGFAASVEIDTEHRLGNIAHFRHYKTALEVVALHNASLADTSPLLAVLQWIDGEAPAKEPCDGPTVGFQTSGDPDECDGNETVREAFQEGVARGLWIAANAARSALTARKGPDHGRG